MLTEKQKKTCEKYSARDEQGYVHCCECPLVISFFDCSCRANYHYNRHTREWEPDVEAEEGE